VGRSQVTRTSKWPQPGDPDQQVGRSQVTRTSNSKWPAAR
jgi:hypothetical protein